jgi:glycosyltransferase involved in cell wall biosynthesis
MRGGERVLEQICKVFPNADIYTHVVNRERLSETLLRHNIYLTGISRLPYAASQYKKYLAFMPRALEELDLSAYDLVISSESGPAKGIIPSPRAKHICYCHSPMRYVWDYYATYKKTLAWPARKIFERVAHNVRQWDVTTAARVDHFVANSRFVSQRIERYYRRDSEVLNPPVNLTMYNPVRNPTLDYYLLVSELVPYKRTDIAIEAFRGLNRKLLIAGDGSDMAKLKAAAPPNVEFLGRVSDVRLANLYANCRALIFPGEEDFGIVPLEAMASGRPVIAFGSGGALETVVDGRSGLFFQEQSYASLQKVIMEFELKEGTFETTKIRSHAESFSEAAFREKFLAITENVLKQNE